MKTKLLLTLPLTLAIAGSANATLVLVDNMDYGGSDITGSAGATAGDWNIPSNRVNYRTGTNLTFSGDADYVNDANNTASTGAMERNGNAGERLMNRDFSDAGLAGDFWLSTVVQLTNPTSGYAGISLNTTAASTDYVLRGDLIGIGYSGTALAPVWYDDSAASTTFSTTKTLTASSTVLMVAKLNIGVGNDSFSLWVFDSDSTFGLTEASLGTAHLTATTVDFGNELDKIQLGGNPFQSYYDQIRISDLSGDGGLQEVLTAAAIPEPSSTALLGLAGLALILRRRK